jgi:hypothetical protein
MDAEDLDDNVQVLLVSLFVLGNKLNEAFPEQAKNSSPEHQRAQFVCALGALSGFLRANNAPLYFAQQLFRLAIALLDLNDGKTDPLLKPTPFGKANSGKATTEWLNRANAALGVAALIAAGEHRNEAAAHGSRKTGIEKPKLVNWYDEFSKPNPKINASLARELFNSGRHMIEAVGQDVAAKRALAEHFFSRAQVRKQS